MWCNSIETNVSNTTKGAGNRPEIYRLSELGRGQWHEQKRNTTRYKSFIVKSGNTSTATPHAVEWFCQVAIDGPTDSQTGRSTSISPRTSPVTMCHAASTAITDSFPRSTGALRLETGCGTARKRSESAARMHRFKTRASAAHVPVYVHETPRLGYSRSALDNTDNMTSLFAAT